MGSVGWHAGIVLTLAILVLVACGPEPEPPPASPGPWAGQQDGRYFYPDFQRWRIAAATPLPGAQVPPDQAGIPVALYGRDVYLAGSYFSFPALNAVGETLVPACFSTTARELRVRPVGPASLGTGPADDRGWRLQARPDGGLELELDRRFRLTLESRPLQDDEGYQQRRLDALFNRQLADLLARNRQPPCTMAPREVPLAEPRSVVLQSADTGRRLTLAGADLDPETPLSPRGASVPRRRSLPLGDPAGIVAGCAGVVRVLRAVMEPAADDPDREEFLLVGGITGKTAEGEVCDRVDLVRRIDPRQLLALYGLPGEEPLVMRLLGWVDDDTFTARVGDAEFELSGVDQPRILVSLTREPGTEADLEVELEDDAVPLE